MSEREGARGTGDRGRSKNGGKKWAESKEESLLLAESLGVGDGGTVGRTRGTLSLTRLLTTHNTSFTGD